MRLSKQLLESGYATRLTRILRAIKERRLVEPEDRRWLGHFIGPVAIPEIPWNDRYKATTAAAITYLVNEFVYQAKVRVTHVPVDRLAWLPARLISDDLLTAEDFEAIELVARTLRSHFLRPMCDCDD